MTCLSLCIAPIGRQHSLGLPLQQGRQRPPPAIRRAASDQARCNHDESAQENPPDGSGGINSRIGDIFSAACFQKVDCHTERSEESNQSRFRCEILLNPALCC